jgi:oligosaccharide repeat unit polymerase
VAHPAFQLSQPGGVPNFVGYSPRATYAAALALALLGALGFYLGYYSAAGAKLGSRIAVPTSKWSRATLNAFVIGLTVVSIGLFSLFIASTGGLSTIKAVMAGRNAGSVAALHQSSGYLYSAPLWITPLAVLLLARAPKLRSGMGVAGFLLLSLSQVLALALGDRSWLIPAAASVILVMYLRRAKRPGLVAVAMGLLVVFIFGITLPRQYRNGLDGISLVDPIGNTFSDPGRQVAEFLGGPDTGMADDFAIELQFVPASLDYQLGNTYLEALVRPVPRALWANKPIEADSQLMQAMWPTLRASGGGFAFSFFGEPFLNFGAVGVFILAFIFGMLCRTLYAWFLRAPENRAVIAIYALSWPFTFVYMRGGFGVDYQRQLIYVLPILGALLVAGIRSRRLRESGYETAAAAGLRPLAKPQV